MAIGKKLPLGIRNNNPGNIRSNFNPDQRITMNEGFVVYPQMVDGCECLARLIQRYAEDGHTTSVFAFVSRYAPASENDVTMYCDRVAQAMGIIAGKVRTQNLNVMEPWRALDLMRAIIAVENGVPPYDYNYTSEWVEPSILLNGLHRSTGWIKA